MRDLNVSGGRNSFHIENYPSQKEFSLESIDPDPFSVKFTPSEKKKLKKAAGDRGIGVSRMLREMIRDYIELKPKIQELHNLLDDMFK